MYVKYKTPEPIKLDEKNQVEEPFLKQLEGLGWTVKRLEEVQRPHESLRENFTEVVILPELRSALIKINPWMEDIQVEDVIRRITTFSSRSLIENNRQVLNLLLENTSVSENRQTGEKSPTVRFIDFENRDNNSFLAISQFNIRVLGTEHYIVPDIVLFINGLPVVVVECKSPKRNQPMHEAIDQLLRYSEQRGAKKEGSPPLFYYNQFVVATSRIHCKFGTISSHIEKFFFRWADPFPRTLNDLEHGVSSPNDQQRLVAGMLNRDNLLSLIRVFTIYNVNEKGQLVKIVARYQQFRAVKKAVKRLLEGKNRKERSGIIWHTQGSGKSLTMMFMVREMYRHPQLCNWKVVFVTDRTQLEKQLFKTSDSAGFTVKVADRISKLKKLLQGDSSDLIMAMIHKFKEPDLKEVFPELNISPTILIMIDEAHRSQYELLGANLDKALPNAAKIGYTGTPIDKTEKTFGDYIDKYTMRQSQEDGVTLQIVYEGRTHNAEVVDRESMDTAFADMFSEYNFAERLQILGYGSRNAYLEAEDTIKAKASDMIDHYLRHIFPNGYKAQVVATSQEAAVRYEVAMRAALKEKITKLEQENPQKINLDLLRTMRVETVISGGHNELPHINERADKDKHEVIVRSFKLPFDAENEDVKGDVGIVVVMNMLITGFDAPYEQVMYLDRKIVSHNLLQAIARVNRIGDETKDKGFVVDYVGVGHHLKEALDSYDEREQKEILKSLSSEEDELNNLIAAHRETMDLLKKHGITYLDDHDAIFDIFYDEEIRFEYIMAFKKLTKAMNLVFPRKEALDFFRDYQMLTEINVLASRHFRDHRLSMRGIPAKLRTITDDYLQSIGIDQKIEPISILDENFQQEVGKRKRAKTKAAEVEHAIRNHLEIYFDEDPEQNASFAQELERILKEFKDNWDLIYKLLEKLRQKIKNMPKPPGDLHRKKHMPFFRIFSREIYGKIHGEDTYSHEEEDNLVELTREVFNVVKRELELTGFWESIPARNRLKAEIQKVLVSKRFNRMPDIVKNRNHIISRLMETAESNNDIILYAE